MKRFNITGLCIPSKHYMVDLTARVKEIKHLVDDGKYFTINRARQYGKTTTLSSLRRALSDSYCVASVSFEKISEVGYVSEHAFVKAFCRLLKREIRNGLVIPGRILEEITEYQNRKHDEATLDELFDVLLEWCDESDKPIVLMIDEIDTAANHQVFIDFLAQLRSYYLDREDKETKRFNPSSSPV